MHEKVATKWSLGGNLFDFRGVAVVKTSSRRADHIFLKIVSKNSIGISPLC